MKYTFLKKEHVLSGIGRADIYNPDTHEIWEIKYGGSSDAMKAERVLLADSQVSRYIKEAMKDLNTIYHKGHAGAFNGQFILCCDSISYLITYDTPKAGVILYYVEQLKKKELNAFATYPSKEYNYANTMVQSALGVGCGYALAACIFGMGSPNRGLQRGLTH